jgi:cytochrome oxidase Cu insertion factor (SCO1/SenC/PrrC family)
MKPIGGAMIFLFLLAIGSSGQAPASVQDSLSIGLSVGQSAPAFEATDQFGRTQNLETLRGKNGTVVLFFRSADW